MALNRKKTKILITAVEGDVGEALVKSLKLEKNKYICHGCDIKNQDLGSRLVRSFHILPPATHPDYLKNLEDLCCSLEVDAVIPSSEAEIRVLSHCGNPPRLPSGIPVICQESLFFERYSDKLTTMEDLSGIVDLAPFANGSNRSAVDELVIRHGFPLIIKERRSRGSKEIHVVSTLDELKTVLPRFENAVVQGFIDDHFGEFSVGVFYSRRFKFFVAFKRNLGLTGASWYAEISDDPDVLLYAKKIADHICPQGSINIQVRKSSHGVRLLEINPRFSSLTAARAICGFRDAEWSLELALGTLSQQNSPKIKKIRFKRYIGELIDFGNGFRSIPAWESPNAKNYYYSEDNV
jgi:carbamoyl-phosphate synthase large subunit